MPERVKRPTINDVAAESGFSRATVSLVLRDSRQIGKDTQAKVRAAMARLNYVYDRRAADMRRQYSHTLGLVVANVRNPYFAELTMAIEEAVHDRGYTLLLGYSRDDVARQRQLLETMTERRIDGLIILPSSQTVPEDMRQTVVAAGVPHVLVARRIRNYSTDYVGSDNVRSGRLVGQHLGQMGVASVAFLGGPWNSVPREDRLKGVKDGLKRVGLEVGADLASASDGPEGGLELVERMLAQGACPDAIVAYNDMFAFGILHALRSKGIEPGREVAVASFDNVPGAALQVPGLTSADGFPARVGAEAARLFLERLENTGRPAKRVLIEPDLVLRGSTMDWSHRRLSAI
jgi:LacI family transcriptional regulator